MNLEIESCLGKGCPAEYRDSCHWYNPRPNDYSKTMVAGMGRYDGTDVAFTYEFHCEHFIMKALSLDINEMVEEDTDEELHGQ